VGHSESPVSSKLLCPDDSNILSEAAKVKDAPIPGVCPLCPLHHGCKGIRKVGEELVLELDGEPQDAVEEAGHGGVLL